MTQILEQTLKRFLIRDFSTCLKFNGTSASASLGNLGVLSTSQFTITGWVKGGNTSGRIFSEGSTTTSIPNYDILCDATNARKMQIWVKNDANVAQKLATTTQEILKPTGWTFIAWVDNAGVVSVYSMGELMTTTELNYTKSGVYTLNNVRLGARALGTPSGFFAGQLDDFRIWKGTCLTQAQIRDLMYKGTNSSTPSAYYKMDEASGTSLTDSSGNGNTGIITAATYSTDVAFKPRPVSSGRVPKSGRIAIS